jgi:hypothetical protein
MLLRTDQPKKKKIPHLYPAADAEPVAKFCLEMDSLLRRLKDAATMPHLHDPYL